MDRTKVIQGIEECLSASCRGFRTCPYNDDEWDIMRDALALLKGPEIVPVKEDKINKCKCGETICLYWHPKFCGFCGRELLWY